MGQNVGPTRGVAGLGLAVRARVHFILIKNAQKVVGSEFTRIHYAT